MKTTTEQIAALSADQREQKIKAIIGPSYETRYGSGARLTLPEQITMLEDFILGQSIAAPVVPAPAAAPAPAIVPVGASVVPPPAAAPVLAVTGLERATLYLVRQSAKRAAASVK
jgi:hypothetical protein